MYKAGLSADCELKSAEMLRHARMLAKWAAGAAFEYLRERQQWTVLDAQGLSDLDREEEQERMRARPSPSGNPIGQGRVLG